ncbi:hypothetical protein [Mesorhizobium loti]|uniref:hypothetical protein n=1 Tax=Rhizobium loti TaxID=381 RepID=UPI0004221E1A|nr:hypothetical protein [Mesorhizobium loti]
MSDRTDDLIISVSTDVSTVKRQLTQLGQDIGQVTSKISNQFEAMSKGIDQSFSPVQRRINDMVGIPYTGKVKEWTGALAGFGKELDHAGGHAAGSATQMMALQHSARSMIEQLALGTSPLQALTAQFSHLSFVASQPGGLTGALKTAGTTALGLVTKFPYVTAAIAAAGAAFAAYELIGGKSVETLDEIIKKHADNILLLGDAYDQVVGKQQKYALVSGATVNLLNDSDAAKVKAKLQAAIGDIFASATTGSVAGGYRSSVKTAFEPFQDAIKDLQNSARDTSALQKFLAAVTAISAVNPDFKDIGAQLAELSRGALLAAGELPGVTAKVTPLDDAFGLLKAAIDDIKSDDLRKQLQAMMDDAKNGKGSIDDVTAALATLSGANLDLAGPMSALQALFKAAVQARDAVGNVQVLSPLGTIPPVYSGGGKFQNEDQVQTDRANATKSQYQIELEKGAKHSGSKAPKKTAADQFDNDLQAIQDRTAALTQEQASLGLTYEAQQKRQISLQLEQTALKQVREEARKKGDTDWQNAQLTPDQIAKIDAVSEAYAREAEALKKAQAIQQLQRDVLQTAFDDLRSSLEQGQLNWKTFGKVAEDVLDRITADVFKIDFEGISQ